MNLFEKAKDLFYDSYDYLLILVVVLVVSSVIGWRLGGLFSNDVNASLQASADFPSNLSKETETSEQKSPVSVTDAPVEAAPSTDEEKTTESAPGPQEDKPTIITVTIPSGSPGPTIAGLLVERNMIDSKNDFLARAKELGLDTKLRSGTFDIPSDSSLDDMIRIIANARVSTKKDINTSSPSQSPEGESKIVTVDIPAGSLGSTIAGLLVEKNMVDSKSTFLTRAKELNLDTKLRSGTFKIPMNSSLDNIIRIIAGK